MTERLYLDHAATTPMLPAARDAMAEALVVWANPSSPHAEGRRAKAALEEARGEIARAYGWDGEVLFTSGASEALAIALGRANVARRLVSAVEHDAVLRAAGDAEVLPVGGDGRVDPYDIGNHLSTVRPERVEGRPVTTTGGRPSAHPGQAGEVGRGLIAVQWANSETGVRQPIAALADAVHDAGHLLLVDAAQMPAGADRDVAAHADFVALSAHKRGGSPGIGALLVRDLTTLSPTGGQERGYRAGTENVPAAASYAVALAEPEPLERWAQLRAALDDAIIRSGGELVAHDAPRHPAIGGYRMPGLAATTQLIRFDMAGIAVSAGSACASGSMKPSHVLAAMGWSEPASREVIRVSFGRETNEADIDRFVAEWRAIARSARSFAA